MNKNLYFIIGIILFILGLLMIVLDFHPSEDILDENYKEFCPNFNSHDFLLSGGSSNPENLVDLDYEMRRLNWLCNGGSS